MELYRFQHPLDKDYITIYALVDSDQEVLYHAELLNSGSWEIEHLATLNSGLFPMLIDLRGTAPKGFGRHPKPARSEIAGI